MKNSRQSISKKLRIEIFKRDGFRCTYCGKEPPYCILCVDHINPVSKGGDNDILNLVTSCEECNLGKSATLVNDRSFLIKQKNELNMLLAYLNSKGVWFACDPLTGGSMNLSVDEIFDWCSDRYEVEAKWQGVSKEHYISFCEYLDQEDHDCEFIDEKGRQCNKRAYNYLEPYKAKEWNPELKMYCTKHETT